ncbi:MULTISPECIES: MerR family transcriptional regulator [Pseudomonas]|uniref:MerR family transcriptional regulator n=1 Tax=Pseudomonas TaxID=286 RepID=UPI001C81DC41|nr:MULTISPECIES: MerR family transcriptional regulator [Pseudomonas]MDH0893277.1 MerR family transcriptional regulator [Pseudomonas sp. GD03875]MDH1064217.1 MerR family transcriptional regulator [Pseudomonas sp. GD03985]
MKIGELAKLSGLTASRIRFYESSGLIRSVERKANGYRDYGPEAVWILEIIAGAQNAGFSLEEIRNLLPVSSDAWRHDELLESLKRKVGEIEMLQKRLEQNKAQLLIVIEGIETKPEGMRCADNTQRLLNRFREDGQEEKATGESSTPV